MPTKRELQKQGFRPVPGFDALYINRAGEVYDYRRKRILLPRPKNRVAYADKQISVPRLLLLAYRKQPYNTRRQIRYIDGDKTNIEVDNLSYTPDPSTLRIDYADLYTAVRCYFQVPKRYKATDRAMTKIYLSDIVRRRGFLFGKDDCKAIEIFGAYLDNPILSLNSVADQFGIPARLCVEMINPLICELIRNVMADYCAGTLQMLDYQPRKKTTAQAIKEYNETVRKPKGLEPIKIPRKKSTAQLLKDWNDRIEAFKKERENTGDSL
jgi:hypothetical protein